jgi:hypothetical protein
MLGFRSSAVEVFVRLGFGEGVCFGAPCRRIWAMVISFQIPPFIALVTHSFHFKQEFVVYRELEQRHLKISDLVSQPDRSFELTAVLEVPA